MKKINKNRKYVFILLLLVVIGGVYKYVHRHDTRLEDVFVENEELERVVNDKFIDNILDDLKVEFIKNKYSILIEEKLDISYGANFSSNIITYGNRRNIFKYINTGNESLLLYSVIRSNKIVVNNIKIGDSYSSIKNILDLEKINSHNFKVTPLDGGLFLEFYFDDKENLEKLIFKDTYIH